MQIFQHRDTKIHATESFLEWRFLFDNPENILMQSRHTLLFYCYIFHLFEQKLIGQVISYFKLQYYSAYILTDYCYLKVLRFFTNIDINMNSISIMFKTVSFKVTLAQKGS